MWDVDGHELVDFVLGWGTVILGHCHPGVTARVQAQAGQGVTFGAQHHLEYLVAEKVLSHFPFAQRLLFSNTGSEAVQVALRLSRARTGRSRVLKFVGHYHGWTDGVLVSYRPPADSQNPRPESRGQSDHAVEDVLVARWNDRRGVEQMFREHPDDIAAVIAEPVLCNSGVISPEPGFLEFLREITERSKSVLIFDEVITGYRVGLHGSVGRFGVKPDLVVLGKAIANGYPLSVVAGRADIVDLAAGGGVVHAGTFNGNPIVLAAALETLTALEQPGVYSRLETTAEQLWKGLQEIFAVHGVKAVVNQVGGVLQVLPKVERARDYQGYAEGDWEFYDDLSVQLLARNIFVMPGGRLYVCLAHTADDIRQALQAFDVGLASTTSSRGG